MALFSLTDIKFKQDRTISKLPLVEDRYRKNIMKYPVDIGEVDKGHYMIFHVFEQDKSDAKLAVEDMAKIQRNRLGLAQKGITNVGGSADLFAPVARAITDPVNKFKEKISDAISSKIPDNIKSAASSGIIKSSGDLIGGVFNETVKRIGQVNNVNFARKIKRTTETIALYMPDTLNVGQNQYYSSVSPGGEALPTLNAAGSSLQREFLKGSSAETLGRNLAPFASPLLKNAFGKLIGQNTAEIFAYTAFGVVNPQMELLYSRPDFRSFNFDFVFYPRSEYEAMEVQRIISSFQYHQVPQLDSGTAGFFLTPPSEFDIDFYYNGAVNKNLPNLSTCVLTSINVDYAPGGFVAYESPETFGQPRLGSTGMPYSIRMTLNFQETEIMTKSNYINNLNPDPNDPGNRERDL